MEDALPWSLYISAIALAGMYVVAAPGLIYLARKGSIKPNAWLIPAAAVGVWWCMFLGAIGATSPFNVIELIYLGMAFVAVVYVLLVALYFRQSFRPIGVPALIGTLIAVVALRVFMPEVGE